MCNEERIWELISVKLTGEITADESAELECIISGSADIENLVQSLEALFHPSAQVSENDIVKQIEKLLQRL